MKKYAYTLILIAFAISGCKKEIDFEYNSIDKLYIIEGRLSNETTEVLITRTQDMTDSVSRAGLGNALVTVSSDNGTVDTLQYDGDGYFRSPSGFTGEAGRNYTLSVSIDDQQFVSQSMMNKQTDIVSADFQWMQILDQRLLMCILIFNDIPDEENYYCYYMNRNGERYRWGLLDDRGNRETIEEYIVCMMENNELEDEENILNEGDEITIEVHTIDRRAFDYLYSLMLSNRASSNPIKNFSGGGLGYFSAYSVARYASTFGYPNS